MIPIGGMIRIRRIRMASWIGSSSWQIIRVLILSARTINRWSKNSTSSDIEILTRNHGPIEVFDLLTMLHLKKSFFLFFVMSFHHLFINYQVKYSNFNQLSFTSLIQKKFTISLKIITVSAETTLEFMSFH